MPKRLHDDGDDDDDYYYYYYDGKLAHGWRPPYGGERAQRDNFPEVDSELFRRDSELGYMLMTCGKLSHQTPSVKSRFSGSRYSSA